MLDQLRKEIDSSIAAFLAQVKKDYRLHLVDPILYNSIREFSLRPGKRIRPLLMILSYLGYAPKGRKPGHALYHASTCIEFLHNFMLIHDDIIDRSDLRRGKPTMHRVLRRTITCPDPDKLGVDLAIIAGDIVYALAIDAFLSIDEEPRRKERALKYFIQTAVLTAMGEFVDTVQGVNQLKNIREKDVFLNYSLKTARYTFDCPLVTGAILAGAPSAEVKKLADFGLLIGQAFQIQDDIIGIFETEKKIGKSILSDLEEQKKTLLIVYAARALKGKALTDFLKVFHKPRKTLHDLETVKEALIKSGSLDYALNAVKIRVQKADQLLSTFGMHPGSRKLIKESLFTLFQQAQKVAEKNQTRLNLS